MRATQLLNSFTFHINIHLNESFTANDACWKCDRRSQIVFPPLMEKGDGERSKRRENKACDRRGLMSGKVLKSVQPWVLR